MALQSNFLCIFLIVFFLFRNKVLCEDSIFVPLRNSVIGLFSLKSSEIEVELDSQKLAESEIKQLGELMSIKPCVQDQKLVLAAYESGDIALWDLRMKSILSWLKIEQCPFSIDLDETLKLGIVGSSTNKLEVTDYLLFKMKLILFRNNARFLICCLLVIFDKCAIFIF